jgi:hypothetical protein
MFEVENIVRLTRETNSSVSGHSCYHSIVILPCMQLSKNGDVTVIAGMLFEQPHSLLFRQALPEEASDQRFLKKTPDKSDIEGTHSVQNERASRTPVFAERATSHLKLRKAENGGPDRTRTCDPALIKRVL